MDQSVSHTSGLRSGDSEGTPIWTELERFTPPGNSREGSVDEGLCDAGPLQFLHVDEPYHPPNKTHRRAVRQHVMRNFHNRRRKKKVSPVKKRKLERKEGQDAVPQPRSHSIVETELTHSANASASPPSVPTDIHAEFDGIESVDSPRPGNPKNLPDDVSDCQEQYGHFMVEEGSAAPSEASLGSPEVHDIRRPTIYLPQFDMRMFNVISPYLLLQSDGAPYLCFDANRWPFTQRFGGAYPKLSVWMPQMSEAPLNLKGPRACLHRCSRILPYIENSPEYFEFKINTIKWINERLKCAENSLSDTTMGSIMLLTSFEAGRGNYIECMHHLDGLERIVELKGGIHKFSNKKHIQLKILLLDMIVATMSNTVPRFPTLKSPLPLIRPLNMPGINVSRIYDSPLYSSGTLIDALEESKFSDESIHALQRLRDLTIFASRGLNINTAMVDFIHTSPDDYYSQAQSIDGDSDILYPAPSLDRVIQLTASIYLGAISNPPIPFFSHQNWAFAQELCAAIESPANDSTWDQFPGILTWVLLTGVAAAKEFFGHSLLMSLLVRVGLGAGYGWWEELTEMMITFMKIKRKAEVG